MTHHSHGNQVGLVAVPVLTAEPKRQLLHICLTAGSGGGGNANKSSEDG